MKIILPNSTINIMQVDPVSITSILDKLTINPSDVIVSRNGKLVPEDTLISGDDEIRIIRIAHGG
jgi:sulfur carrier protein